MLIGFAVPAICALLGTGWLLKIGWAGVRQADRAPYALTVVRIGFGVLGLVLLRLIVTWIGAFIEVLQGM